MRKLSRRTWTGVVLGAPFARALANAAAAVNGVAVGVQSYSFRDRSLEEAIRAMRDIGVGYCELWAGHVEPRRQLSPEELRKWRQRPPLEIFQWVRARFEAAGIVLTAYSYTFRDDSTEQEIASGLQMARALGVEAITASSNVATARRLDKYAARARVKVGMHNHSRIIPNEFATPDDFEKAIAGASPFIGINLDIGHFVAAGFDPLAFIQKHHPRIVSVHLKDRKKNQGADMRFGEGDTPIREVLQLMKDQRYRFPAMIEYEREAGETATEVRRCFEFCKRALAQRSIPQGRT